MNVFVRYSSRGFELGLEKSHADYYLLSLSTEAAHSLYDYGERFTSTAARQIRDDRAAELEIDER